MSEYLSQADIVEWLARHGLDPHLVKSIEIDAGMAQTGSMRVVLAYVEPGTKIRRVDPVTNELLTEERIVRLQELPGQETISFETSV